MVRGRTCTADVRVAHRNKRCHVEVGAPAQQDEDSAVVRTMSRRPRTETSGLWTRGHLPIEDHHGVDGGTRGYALAPGWHKTSVLMQGLL